MNAEIEAALLSLKNAMSSTLVNEGDHYAIILVPTNAEFLMHLSIDGIDIPDEGTKRARLIGEIIAQRMEEEDRIAET